MKRVAVLALFVLVLAGLYQRHVRTEPGQVRQLAPGVWTRIGDNSVRVPANTSWIEFKDFVVVIDANTPWGAKAALDEIKKTTSKPIKYVFDTHYHWDHTQGNSLLMDAGITVVCSQDCANELRSAKGVGEWASMSKRTDQYSLAPYRLQPPTLTFGDFMQIDDGERRLELRRERAAHLWRAIDALSEKLRIVIVLAGIQEYDIREISTLLELPEGTVKSRLFAARQQLKDALSWMAPDRGSR